MIIGGLVGVARYAPAAYELKLLFLGPHLLWGDLSYRLFSLSIKNVETIHVEGDLNLVIDAIA